MLGISREFHTDSVSVFIYLLAYQGSIFKFCWKTHQMLKGIIWDTKFIENQHLSFK